MVRIMKLSNGSIVVLVPLFGLVRPSQTLTCSQLIWVVLSNLVIMVLLIPGVRDSSILYPLEVLV